MVQFVIPMSTPCDNAISVPLHSYINLSLLKHLAVIGTYWIGAHMVPSDGSVR